MRTPTQTILPGHSLGHSSVKNPLENFSQTTPDIPSPIPHKKSPPDNLPEQPTRTFSPNIPTQNSLGYFHANNSANCQLCYNVINSYLQVAV